MQAHVRTRTRTYTTYDKLYNVKYITCRSVISARAQRNLRQREDFGKFLRSGKERQLLGTQSSRNDAGFYCHGHIRCLDVFPCARFRYKDRIHTTPFSDYTDDKLQLWRSRMYWGRDNGLSSKHSQIAHHPSPLRLPSILHGLFAHWENDLGRKTANFTFHSHSRMGKRERENEEFSQPTRNRGLT